jgi:signal transduction histidine kinase
MWNHVGPFWRAALRAAAGPDYPPLRSPLARWPQVSAYLRVVGIVLLGIIGAATLAYQVDQGRLPVVLAAPLAVLAVAPVPALARGPLLAWRISTVGLWLDAVLGQRDGPWPWSPTQIVVGLLVLAVVALRADGPVVAVAGLLNLLPVWIFLRGDEAGGATFLTLAVLVIGDQVRRLRGTRRALVEQTEVSELEQSRRTVLEERTRIARELHDVVAHHMSLIAVQAETAPFRLGELPEPARAEFVGLAAAARDALTDMRRLLGVLRSEDAPPEREPQPDLAAVDHLVTAARRAGVAVHYLPPDAATLDRAPEAVALAGYRIVQEALANASRHAPGAPVTVQVWPGRSELTVRVHNDRADGGSAEPGDGGHGLTGMRERATALGGELTAGPTADGGFAVTATLPYGGGAAQEGPTA